MKKPAAEPFSAIRSSFFAHISEAKLHYNNEASERLLSCLGTLEADISRFILTGGNIVSLNSETKLVEAARNGHLESFGALYERYHSPMVALAYSMLADRDLAEDAAQEVFAVACRDIGSLKSKEKFVAWLAGICRNVSRQMLRANRIKPAALSDEHAAQSG